MLTPPLASFYEVDLSINIRIGPSFDRVQEFVFKMGPARLDAYLNFEVEECIRSLVNSKTYNVINDLRSEFSVTMLTTLQGKMAPFGVDVMNVKITDVQLPFELQNRLEKTTAFGTRISEQEKNHRFAVQQITNEHTQKMAAIDQSVSLDKQRIVAETSRYEIEQDEKMSVAQSDRKVRMETAKGAMDVAVTKARGAVEVAQYEGRADAEATVKTTAIACERDLRESRIKATKEIKAAEASKTASVFLAKALETEAKAMGEATEQLQEKRRFEQKVKLAEIDVALASHGRKFLSGDAGESIIKSFVMVRDDLAVKEWV